MLMEGRTMGHPTLSLVAVVLLLLLLMQWLYQFNSDRAQPTIGQQEDVQDLKETMAEVIREQTITQKLLLQLLSASSSPSPPEVKTPEKVSSAVKYEPTGYKRWLTQMGQSHVEAECEKHTGLTLVERFRETGQDWCTSTIEGDTKEKSSMRCYPLPGWGARQDKPDVICEGFNMVLDFEKIPWTPPTTWDSSGGNRQFNFQEGAFGARCEVNRTLVALAKQHGLKLWKTLVEIQDDDQRCDMTIDHPVVIIMRREAWNMYHMLCDWLNAFISLEVVGELDKNTQLLFLDMHEDTEPFTPLLKAFSPNHPLLIGKQLVGKGKVCLKHAILPWGGYGNFIHNNAWRASRGEPCVESQVIEAFSHFILNKMVMLEKPIPDEPSITLIVRKDYMGRHISRAFGNEGELIKMLEDVTRGRGKLQVVQLESMNFTEQVELVYSKTNILIGAHGAGLSHLIFLPPEAIVVEVVPSSMRSFTYFRNLAKLSSKIYIPSIASGEGIRPLINAYGEVSTEQDDAESLHVDIGKLRTVVDVALTIANSFNTRIN